MVSAEVHSTVENVAPKKKQLNFLVSFTHIAEGKKKKQVEYAKRRNNFLQHVIIAIHSQIADLHQKENKLFNVVAFFMKLKVFPYEGIASCMHLILIYYMIITKAISY